MVQVHQYEDPVREPYKGQFGRMKFPPYKFQEYPKVIGQDKYGKDVIAQNQREEVEFLARGEIEVAKADSAESERQLAVALAAQMQDENAELKRQLEDMKAQLAAKAEPPKLPYQPDALETAMNEIVAKPKK